MNHNNQEIEYKFIVISDEWKIISKSVYYKQGYLSIDNKRTVRVRLEGEISKLTIKGEKSGPSGKEFEYEIPFDHAVYILENLCFKPLIEKKRYKVNHDGFIWDVDEFLGENEGLVIAEIELDRINQDFTKPVWVGENVTGDPKYKNANLVRNPFKNWKKL
ncbi:MAG: CYTH domain-containing protein [Ignavibacteriaceae bacterium]